MMTCLCWILGYMRDDEARDLGTKWPLSIYTDVFAQCYALIVIRATIGFELDSI